MPKKIVMIEDEPDITGLVTHYLEKEGYRITAVRDGVNGLRRIKAEPPDLLILDIMLPEMDGLE
ncbi:MAG TPA: response regulator, partial [Nitrospiria bacterium]